MFLLFILALIVGVAGVLGAVYITETYESFGLAVLSVFTGILIAFTLTFLAASHYEDEYKKDATRECKAAGGDHILLQYRSQDLCLTTDGRVVWDWKR